MKLKAYTTYICPVGAGKLGHSSQYTGSYQGPPRATDGICACGIALIDEASTKDGCLYQLTFEICDPRQAAEMERRYGRRIWKTLDEQEWAALKWVPVSKESDKRLEIKAQYEQLLAWAESHGQPIRNVQLVRAGKP